MSVAEAPKFEQIKRRIIADIESGVLSPGARIASETELMQRHDVARMTVQRSLNEMADEGYLVRIKGKGTFVRVPHHGAQDKKLAAFALVIPELRDGIYPSLVKSFSDAAGELHHQVLTCNTDNDVRKQGDIILQLIDKQVAGVALVPTTIGSPPMHHVRQLQARGIPVVLLHRGVSGVAAPLIALELEAAARMAGHAMVSAGHRRIAFFITQTSQSAAMHESGLKQSLLEVGVSLSERFVHRGQWTCENVSPEHEAGIQRALWEMLDLPENQRPTAIYSTWEADAELIYMALGKFGIRVPDQISLVSFGGTWRSNAITRRLATVTADEEYTGRMAVQLLDDMCNARHPLDKQFQVSIPLQFYSGSTLRELK
ncbi:MAG: GntR family transcriptional regulator [Pirellulales bacterium]|nr:GntR family transcriptional regulator [Pirellulales bacterium]